MSKNSDTTSTPSTAPPTSESARLLDTYGTDLGGLDLSEEEQKELLLTLWNIMVSFAEIGILVSSQEVKDSAQETGNSGETPRVASVDVLALLHLDDTAHETVAPKSTTPHGEH